jgi:hypothetical protein
LGLEQALASLYQSQAPAEQQAQGQNQLRSKQVSSEGWIDEVSSFNKAE